MRCLIYLLLIAAFIIACAPTKEMGSARGSRYIITAEEIAATSANNAYEAIQLLRPNLLNRDERRSIDMYSTAGVVVYVQGVKYGDKESLKTISALEIAEIRYLPKSEATMRFGSDHAGGAFLIELK
ncbi:MAG: hypothetical protein ACFFDN_42170 [Candidatus Hodarchaeota archaeon]